MITALTKTIQKTTIFVFEIVNKIIISLIILVFVLLWFHFNYGNIVILNYSYCKYLPVPVTPELCLQQMCLSDDDLLQKSEFRV